MIRIIGISGSLRKGSFNASLLRTAAEVAPENCTVEVNSIRGIPLYDADQEESEGIPPVVAELKDRIAVADGLLLVTPEYNNSLAGRVQKCHRLAVPAARGHRARIWRTAGWRDRGNTGQFRYRLFPDSLAAGIENPGYAALVRQTAVYQRGFQGIRCGWQIDR